MIQQIRHWFRQAPLLVWMIIGVFVLDAYLMVLSSYTRQRRPYRLTPGTAVAFNTPKPSPFGPVGAPKRSRPPQVHLEAVNSRPGDAMLETDVERRSHESYAMTADDPLQSRQN